MSNDPRDLITFGSFRLCPASRTLRQAAGAIPLAPKTFDLLLLLAESRGRVLTKKELMDTLWRDVFVEEASLVYQISALRKALGDEGSGWVESVPRIGYRFTAPVEFSDPPPDTVAPPAPPAVVPVRRPWLRPAWLAGGAAIAAVAAFGYWKISEVSRAREALPRIASLTE